MCFPKREIALEMLKAHHHQWGEGSGGFAVACGVLLNILHGV